jgi:hypothetical protein
VHSLPINAALADPDPLVQTLAVLDKRVGKRRLTSLRGERLHRLAAMLLGVRREAEGLERPKIVPFAAAPRATAAPFPEARTGCVNAPAAGICSGKMAPRPLGQVCHSTSGPKA